ncbi:paraquat-inducible protein A [Bathymodiolus japonicus methanotrophic gill symbiont]|uniref:paraquat-inducible protein A n=1 Tax=Bathymodiolus japonicus methanotrophic gill symbiont TaxID=113269 RepID=UPI001B545837|nr:paraquat-inducible protein A [Bathymodiolus japonicus methanotrophic gill symbiont]GFO72350.1 paraquat-inducible protein A [Bathymodiolus japonicus methanotrophic gill symbiont]
MTQYVPITVCHDCGLLQQISDMPEDGAVKCCQCDATLRKCQRIAPAKSIEHTLALVITALVLLVISNVYPIIQVDAEGHEMAATLFGCVKYLFNNEMEFLAGLVFLTTIGAPVIQLAGLLYILLPVHFNRIPPFAPQMYRLVRIVTSWSMLEVLMLGILVSVVKLSALATVVPSIALWTFALLMIFIAAILNDLDTEMLWGQISPKVQGVELQKFKSGVQLINWHNCHLLCTVTAGHESSCPRCDAPIHLRKPDSFNRCTALVIAAFVMYIPANLLPVMEVTSLGKTEGDTIISGVIYLATSGDLPLAIILFIASICVPTIKLAILSFLLISVHFKSQWRPKERTHLYRLTEFIGRWSMVDIFVDTLMAALIQISGLMVIEVGAGAVAFGAVVVLTMLAAMAFDPRLIWDNMEKVNE